MQVFGRQRAAENEARELQQVIENTLTLDKFDLYVVVRLLLRTCLFLLRERAKNLRT